jgi:hypothetical protein
MRQRTLFWPFVLIATGVVWLLIQLRTIPVENLWALMYIWPFFLMAIGVGLILGSRWPVTRMIVSGLTVLGMVLAVVFAPQLGWNRAPVWNFFSFNGVSGSVAGSGVVVSQTRQVADFNAIEINYPAEITIQQGATPSLKVEAEDNLIPQLATRVTGNTLHIENSQPDWLKRVNPTKPVRINMTVKDLTQVDFPSAGTLRVVALKTENLRVSISGAGSVTLSNLNIAHTLTVNLSGAGSISADGQVDTLSTDTSGFGSFRGDNLASQNAEVTISGAGNATVWAKSSLNVDISGTGSVKYYGSPSVQRNISGLGSVSSLGNK